MNIQVKFGIGDKAFTIDQKTMKVREFEVEYINVTVYPEETKVTYRAKGDSAYEDLVPEEKCFTSEADLLNFVTAKAVPEKKEQ